jgi:hypothetical protein
MDVFPTADTNNCIYGWVNVMPDAGCRGDGYRNERSRTSNARPMGTGTSDAGPRGAGTNDAGVSDVDTSLLVTTRLQELVVPFS